MGAAASFLHDVLCRFCDAARAMWIQATDFELAYTVEAPFALPEPGGSLFRGVLGRALRRSGCARPERVCAGACEMPRSCMYARLFDPVVASPSPHRFLKAGARAPSPLIPQLSPVEPAKLVEGANAPNLRRPGPRTLAEGAELVFGVRALARIGDEEERCLTAAFEGLSESALGSAGGRVAFASMTRRWQRNRPVKVDLATLAEGGSSSDRRLRVTFETPAWIEHKGDLIQDLPFPLLFRSISRRMSIMCSLYGRCDDGYEEIFGRLDSLAVLPLLKRDSDPIARAA